jgi:uncharacterized protein (TIGR04222 family)
LDGWLEEDIFMSLGPFDLNGGQFIMLYLLLLAAAIIFSLIIPRLMRQSGRDQAISDPDQLALLVGGPTRLCESVVTRLLTARSIQQRGSDNFGLLSAPQTSSTIEQSVIGVLPASWRTIEQSIKPYAEPMQTRMASLGLLIGSDSAARQQLMQTMPYLLLILFGAVKLFVGEQRHKPVGILTALVLLTLLFAVIRYFIVDRRTEAAISAVEAAKTRAARLKAAPTTPEMGLAVALFGTAVLAGSAYQDFHRLRSPSGDGDGGSSGDGSGGCGGGGGCGGCGG